MRDSYLNAAAGGDRVTVGQIADLAHVRPSAVSNWRRRHRDFPAPVAQTAAGDLFDWQEVLEWLQVHGHDVAAREATVEAVLWSALDALRGVATPEDGALLIMQLLYVRSRSAQSRGDEGSARADFWSRLAMSRPRELGHVWLDMTREVARDNPELERVLELVPTVRAEELYQVIQRIDQIPTTETSWGDVATAFLRIYQDSMRGRGAGRATPEGVTAVVTALLEPIEGSVYDPACGLAMVLAEAWQRRANDEVQLFGQEVNEYNRRLGYLHLAIHDARFALAPGDTIRDDQFRTLRAERVVLEAPFGQKFNRYEFYPDGRWGYGHAATADWMWAQHLVYHLADKGIGVMVAATGALSRGGRDAAVREGIVRAGLLDAVIELPQGIVPGTAIGVALLIFASGRLNRADRVLFVDATQLGRPQRGRAHELAPEDVDRIVNTVAAWRGGAFQEEPLFAAAATIADILAADANISPKRYVRYAAPEQDIDLRAVEQRLSDATETARASLTTVRTLPDVVMPAVHALVPTDNSGWAHRKLKELLAEPAQAGVRYDSEGEGPVLPYIHTRLVTGASGTLDRVPEEHTRGKVKGRLAKRGDLLLASRGIDRSGRVGCVTIRFDEQAAFAESLMLLTPDTTRVDPDYLRLYLTSTEGRETLAAATTGSVIGNLRPGVLEEIEIRLPDLDVQKRIVASVLKIEQGVSLLSGALDAWRTVLDLLRDEIAAGRRVPRNDVIGKDTQANPS